jgi:two-component system, NarL family, sensor kinase
MNSEIYIVIIMGAILAVLLVGFIVAILFLYQRRQHRQELEINRMKEEYERETLKSQLEIQEETFKNIGQGKKLLKILVRNCMTILARCFRW